MSKTYILNQPGPYTVGSHGRTDERGVMQWTASPDALVITEDELQTILRLRKTPDEHRNAR